MHQSRDQASPTLPPTAKGIEETDFSTLSEVPHDNQSHLDITPRHHLLSESMEKELNSVLEHPLGVIANENQWCVSEGIDFSVNDDFISLRRNELNDTFNHGKRSYALLKLPKDAKIRFRLSVSTFWNDFSNLNNQRYISRALEKSFGSLPFFLVQGDCPDTTDIEETVSKKGPQKILELPTLRSKRHAPPPPDYRSAYFLQICPPTVEYIVEWVPEKCLTVSLVEAVSPIIGVTVTKESGYSLCVELFYGSSCCHIRSVPETASLLTAMADALN